jgi:hypothetical protein
MLRMVMKEAAMEAHYWKVTNPCFGGTEDATLKLEFAVIIRSKKQ